MRRVCVSARDLAKLFEEHGGVLRDRLLAMSIPEPNSGCWIWLGASKAKGYGHMWIEDHCYLAHRVSYAVFVGPIPDDHVVMHAVCDLPCCINPDHLKAGTSEDNIHDCISKGRARRGRFPGANNPSAILTEADVAIIRSTPRRYGYRIRLAEAFGVCAGTISAIVAGETWRGT